MIMAKLKMNLRRNLINAVLLAGGLLVIFLTGVNVNAIENYHEARKIFWEELYPEGNTLYCRANIVHAKDKEVNVEHVFPMAWVKNSLNCGTRDECRRNSELFNRIEADLHNLYPALAKLNYERQAYRFGIIKGEERRFGKHCDFEVSKKYRVAEPRQEVRGDVARAMFYMEYQYEELVLYEKQAKILLQWHFADLPSKEEHRRNDKIEKLQGNRNPFIDNPELLKKRIQK